LGFFIALRPAVLGVLYAVGLGEKGDPGEKLGVEGVVEILDA